MTYFDLFVYWNVIFRSFMVIFTHIYILERFGNDQTKKKNNPEMAFNK